MLRVSDGLCLSKWIGFTSRMSPKRRWVENELDEASIGETKKARSFFISIEVRDEEGRVSLEYQYFGRQVDLRCLDRERRLIPSNFSSKKASHVPCFEMCRSEGEHDQEQERPFSELRAKESFQYGLVISGRRRVAFISMFHITMVHGSAWCSSHLRMLQVPGASLNSYTNTILLRCH
jgi:hypothetical protein